MILEDNKKQKVFVTFLAVLIVLQMLYFLNRDVLRPSFQINQFVIILLGSLPNFLAAFAAGIVFIPIGLFYLNKKRGSCLVYLFTTVCLGMLIQEEIQPFIFGSKVGDVNDILASIIGVLCSIFLFEHMKGSIRIRRKVKLN